MARCVARVARNDVSHLKKNPESNTGRALTTELVLEPLAIKKRTFQSPYETWRARSGPLPVAPAKSSAAVA